MELNGNYPNPLPSELLEIRADTWHRELKDIFHKVDEELFLKACSYHLKNSEFYPVLKNIIEGYRHAVENKPKPIALEEPHIELTPDEEIEKNKLIADFKAKKRKIGAI